MTEIKPIEINLYGSNKEFFEWWRSYIEAFEKYRGEVLGIPQHEFGTPAPREQNNN